MGAPSNPWLENRNNKRYYYNQMLNNSKAIYM